MGLHALLEGSGEVWVLRGGLGIVGWGGGGGLAVFVELHVAVWLTVAADAAVTLRVDKRAGVAERAALELPLAKLNGAAAHAQHEALAVVIQSVGTSSKSGIDVGEGHARRYPLLSQGTCVGGVPHLSGRVPCHGRCVMLLEGIYTVVAICRVLLKTHEGKILYSYTSIYHICTQKKKKKGKKNKQILFVYMWMYFYPQSSTEVKVKVTIFNIQTAEINKERVCGLCREKK